MSAVGVQHPSPLMSTRIPLFGLFLSLTLLASAKEQSIPSKVTAAKVFLRGAQVSRTAAAPVPAGGTTVIFTGLSEQLDPQSIQVNGKGGFSILSVNHRINYLSEPPKRKEIEELQARIKQYEHDRATERGLQQVWENEEQLLGKNTAISGQQSGITAAQLQAVNDYVRERMKAVKAGWQAQQEKLTAIQAEMDKLQQQLAQMQGGAPRPTSEVVVEIDAPEGTAASFTLAYFVPTAGWLPAYDLRARNTSGPIELGMKAEIVNNTGEAWDKVDLALSSGNPTLGGTMPQLTAWVLQQPYVLEVMAAGRGRKNKAYADAYSMEDAKMPAPEQPGTSRLDTFAPAITEVGNTVVYNTTTVEFTIDAPFSVPTDGLPHTVGVRTRSIPALYKHYCTPKLDKDAFLYARTTGWEDLDLLPGQANVFFEGTFVGRSFLDLSRPQDTLDISLGRDKGVTVERVKRKSTNDKGALSGKRTLDIGWDITVRNTKGTAVDLEVRDQYPLSPRSEIEVKLEDAGGARPDTRTGQLTWNMRLEPKGTKKLGFAYSVKHPKDMPVTVE